MKLIYRVVLRLSLFLLPLLALWAMLFYFTMEDEINDEADDALDNYSELIIMRMLSGNDLPQTGDGSNNSYLIIPVQEAYANARSHVRYYDAEVYIPEKHETEPARILSTIFRDDDGQYYELRVATPTFEKNDLMTTVLGWSVFLYVILLITVVSLTAWVFHRSMRPLYALLNWLDSYKPGTVVGAVPCDTDITEFCRLSAAAQAAVDRSEELFERQKQFIGNASHELQTPLAVLGARMDWLLDNTELSEEQMGEILQMKDTLGRIVRLNKTLLLLTKIDNNQFPESSDVDIAAMLREQKEVYDEMFAARDICCCMKLPETFTVRMNDALASVLVTNLLRNAYRHSAHGARVDVTISGRMLTVVNDGDAPLDGAHIFERFYQGSKREGSTGLGLALVKAVSDYYGLRVRYDFVDGRHMFSVEWVQSVVG